MANINFGGLTTANNVAFGYLAGNTGQSPNTISIGTYAGQTSQTGQAIAIGYQSGQTNQGLAGIAIGYAAGQQNQSLYGVAIGFESGAVNQGPISVAIGAYTGQSVQGGQAVAIGAYAGQTGYVATNTVANLTTGSNVASITGTTANGPFTAGMLVTGSPYLPGGTTITAVNASNLILSQSATGTTSFAISGTAGQGLNAVAIGPYAGTAWQLSSAVAIGYSAGASHQGINSVAIGSGAANTNQGSNAVAIGYNAGYNNQGVNSVALGYYAGYSIQANNTIILNASGNTLNANTASAFYVNPVRYDNVSAIGNVVVYNTNTSEIAYSNTISVSGNVSACTVSAAGNIIGNSAGGMANTTSAQVGYLGVPQNIISSNYTIALSDQGKHIYSTATGAQTITIPANATTAFPIGASITIILNGTGTISVSPASGVSLQMAGSSTNAARAIASYGMATIIKVAVNTWFISGAGLS